MQKSGYSIIKGVVMKKFDFLEAIINFESGDLRGQEVLELFSQLIKTGQAWSLQGSYGRYTENLIARGYLSSEGEILKAFDAD
jgi:hypothetical protein